MRWRRRGSRTAISRAALRLRPEPAAVDGSLYRAARQRILAARHPQAARLRLHDRGDRPRRRGRPAGHRRAQRPDHPLHAGLPDGRAISTRSRARLHGPSGARRRRPSAAVSAGPGPGRAAPSRPAHVASRAVPMPKASPLAAKPAPRPNRSSRRPRLRRSRPRCSSRGAAGRLTTGSPLPEPSPRPSDRADPGHAEGAGAGVGPVYRRPCLRRRSDRQKNAPVFRGVFHCGPAIPAGPRRPGSGRRPRRAARPATGGRRPVRPSSRSCAWRETVRGRD